MIVGLGYQLVTGSGHMPKAAYCTRRFSCGEGIEQVGVSAGGADVGDQSVDGGFVVGQQFNVVASQDGEVAEVLGQPHRREELGRQVGAANVGFEPPRFAFDQFGRRFL